MKVIRVISVQRKTGSPMLHTLTDVQNFTDLLSALGGINVVVPARIDGRKTHHTETYIACRLLSNSRGGRPAYVSAVREPP